MLRVALITPGAILVEAVAVDPADDMVIACALEGQADFIISGDHHLTDLESYRGIKIIDPATFYELLSSLNEG